MSEIFYLWYCRSYLELIFVNYLRKETLKEREFENNINSLEWNERQEAR